MKLDTSPGWPGFEELSSEEREALLARIRSNQDRGETLGGSRAARVEYGLPGTLPSPVQPEAIPGKHERPSRLWD